MDAQDSDLKEIAGCYRLNQLLLFYSLVKIPYTEQPLCGQSFHSTLKTFGGVLKSMLTLNEAIIDVKEG